VRHALTVMLCDEFLSCAFIQRTCFISSQYKAFASRSSGNAFRLILTTHAVSFPINDPFISGKSEAFASRSSGNAFRLFSGH
jgi:hypothetical protein